MPGLGPRLRRYFEDELLAAETEVCVDCRALRLTSEVIDLPNRKPRLASMSSQALNSHDVSTGHFSSLLKHWRTVRRLTQIELAGDANISARHLCFLETGRAQPSREMIQMLGSALDLPLEERNALHIAAGFVPPYGDRGLAAANLEHVRQALDFILRQQEPYPGIVIDGHWDVRIRNGASERLFKAFRAAFEMECGLADNAMHVVFHPKGLRQFIVNWDEFAGQMIQILHREVAQGSRVAAQLLDEVMTYPGLPAEWRVPRDSAGSSPVMTMQLRKDELRLAFFSTFTTLAMPTDAALQQLKIECFYPADGATAEKARELAR